jgi:hypothetical protein
MRWLVVAALCLGCKGKQQPTPKRDDAALQPIDALVADAAVDAAAADAAVMATEITPAGVGPLTAKHVDVDDFKKALVGFAISEVRQEGEAFAYDEIVAKRGDKQILRAVVQDRSLFKIEVLDPMFATSAGVAVGTTVAQAAAKMKDLRCVFETYDPEEDAERVEKALRCESASLPHVMFEVDLEGFNGPVGKVTPKTIGARTITEIVWLAPHD